MEGGHKTGLEQTAQYCPVMLLEWYNQGGYDERSLARVHVITNGFSVLVGEP
jgi:hypothetical protein